MSKTLLMVIKVLAGKESKYWFVALKALLLVNQEHYFLSLVVLLYTGIPFMTFAQNIGVIGMTVFKLTPQMNGLILSYNGVLGLVSFQFLTSSDVSNWLKKCYLI